MSLIKGTTFAIGFVSTVFNIQLYTKITAMTATNLFTAKIHVPTKTKAATKTKMTEYWRKKTF